MARTMFLCPLCLELGLAITLVAELQEAGEAPAKAIVANVQGGCEHAGRFGELDGQTLMEMWRVIEAALDTASKSTAKDGKKAGVLRCTKCRKSIAADQPRIRPSAASSYHLGCYAKDVPSRRSGG